MSMYVNHAPRLETHSRMHASAYQYMHMDIYTHICMCISMCIFVMRGDSRHIRIYTRACCDRAHLFANMNTYTRLCHIVYTYAYVHAILVHIYICTWTPTRAYVHVYVHVCAYSSRAETRDTFTYAYLPAVLVHIYLQTCAPIRAYVIFVFAYAYVHAILVHIHTCTWTPTRAYVHVCVYVCIYS